MGSYNVSGIVSRLSIGYGAKCVFIPLLPQELISEDGVNIKIGRQSQIVSNDGSECLFVPFCLPIIGRYNDYGSLEEIENDDNTKSIEAFFECSIEQFMEQVTRNWCNEENFQCLNPIKDMLLKSLSGMFEHFEIYRALVDYDREKNSLLKEANLDDFILRLFGFKFIKEDDSIERYKKIYHFPEVSEYIILSDGTWSHIINQNTKKEYDVYSLEQLALEWQELTGITVDVNKYALVSTYDYLYDKFKFDLIDFQKMIQEEKDELKLRFIMSWKDPFDFFQTRSRVNFVSFFERWQYFRELYEKSIIEGKLKNELIDILHFRRAIASCNSFFFPGFDGGHDDNLEASKTLLMKSLEIISKEIEIKEENERELPI